MYRITPLASSEMRILSKIKASADIIRKEVKYIDKDSPELEVKTCTNNILTELCIMNELLECFIDLYNTQKQGETQQWIKNPVKKLNLEC